MAKKTGSYTIESLLAVSFQSVAEFGTDTVAEVLAEDVAAHNEMVQEMLSSMVDFTAERQEIYGSSVDGEMVEVDEFGRSPTQADRPGSNVAYPLRLFQFAVGWTEKWMQVKTPRDLALQVQGAEDAHLRAILRELKRAIYVSANYTYTDHLIDKVALDVKRFVNADSKPIPNGPNGETYDSSTHTHYDANATLTATVLKASINDVIEHGHGAGVRAAINKADETATRALTGFTAYPDPRIIYRNADTPANTLDISRLDNRPIGIFEGAEVWVKPWALANYAFTWDAGSPKKPLKLRQRTATSLQGLRVAAELSSYPLHAKYMEDEYGIGVYTRTNGAVLEFDNGTYQDPTIS